MEGYTMTKGRFEGLTDVQWLMMTPLLPSEYLGDSIGDGFATLFCGFWSWDREGRRSQGK